jgi:hypothetical protein
MTDASDGEIEQLRARLDAIEAAVAKLEFAVKRIAETERDRSNGDMSLTRR